MPHFFLSHARADADPYFETFVADFVQELRGRLGAGSVDGLAFRDTASIQLGARWEPEIERALLTCRTFIAMVSPTYIQRPACSKEWAYFEWRLEIDAEQKRAEHSGQPTVPDKGQPDLLLPLMWIPVPISDRPAAIQAHQLANDALGPSYAKYGLRHVVQRAGTEYRDFLTALAVLVCDLVRRPPLGVPDATQQPPELPDPFAIARPAPAQPSATAAASLGGPRHVEFIVVAAPRRELQVVRRVVAAYGADFEEWCPFRPAVDTPAGLIVQRVAIDENFTSSLLPIEANVVGLLRNARAKNKIVVLVIDVWSLELPLYRTMVSLIDRAERFPNAGVLVVWNLDGETADCEQRLINALNEAFFNLMVMEGPPAFHHRLTTPGELTEKLRAMLQVLKTRITALGNVMRRAEGAAPIAKPQLTGPGGG